MAETLGSLTDKLTIKSIREFYIKGMLSSGKTKFSKRQLRQKLAVLKKQKGCLFREIEGFIALAAKKGIALRDEKLKLYNDPANIGKISKIDSLSKAIDGLSRENLQLWHLEDEARRQDVPLSYIGAIKRKIDVANQKRNDLIDKIDVLLDERIRKSRKNG